jgi:2-dehydro-3-deoxygluconokinase
MADTLEAGARCDPAAAAATLLALGVPRVVVKLGADGALLRDGDGTDLRSPAVPVPHVADPVGAGDAFTAGYIALSLEGASIEAAMRAANTCGALAVSTVGDLTGLPERPTLDALLAHDRGPDTLR